jgi:hypothetical protein
MGLGFAGYVQAHGEQVGMIAEASHDVFGFASGGNHGITGTQSMFCDQSAKTTGSSSNEPSTHINSSCQ